MSAASSAAHTLPTGPDLVALRRYRRATGYLAAAELEDHKEPIREHGEDPAAITGWRWPGR